ncbi:Hypothetical predicted protein [Mytilus galloprovincialis]|uniref:Uncharacterized protein n=1 Tax=Mytilus galloprovincialis TaxID=29158 RepID=A0A8B6EQ53_MYTGA|nr:Hypothetical predicted protein [Mytilus galloprovincialis]
MLTYLFNSRVIDSNNHSEIPTARDDGYIDMVPVKWEREKSQKSKKKYENVEIKPAAKIRDSMKCGDRGKPQKSKKKYENVEIKPAARIRESMKMRGLSRLLE